MTARNLRAALTAILLGTAAAAAAVTLAVPAQAAVSFKVGKTVYLSVKGSVPAAKK